MGFVTFRGEPYSYDIEHVDMAPNFKKMLDNGKRVLLYYGTADIICNFIGARWFANSLQRRVGSDLNRKK